MTYFIMIEGGGTRTWGGCFGDGWITQRHTGATNPQSTSRSAARHGLRALILALVESARSPEFSAITIAHGAAATAEMAHWLLGVVDEQLRELGIETTVVVCNDVLPLLATPRARDVVAVVAGTGTGFAARHDWEGWARASGLEYLLSDEGGGFDVGLAGLRAVIRATDHRGPDTELVMRAARWSATRPADLRATLFSKVYTYEHKRTIADFARDVDAAAQDGDDVATSIIRSASEQILTGAKAVSTHAGVGHDDLTVILGGSMLTRGGALAAMVTRGIHEQLRPTTLATVSLDDVPGMLLGFARATQSLPPWLENASTCIPVAWRGRRKR